MPAAKSKALRDVKRTTVQLGLAKERRDAAIRDALGEASVREVAAASELSSARVHQIRHGR